MKLKKSGVWLVKEKRNISDILHFRNTIIL